MYNRNICSTSESEPSDPVSLTGQRSCRISLTVTDLCCDVDCLPAIFGLVEHLQATRPFAHLVISGSLQAAGGSGGRCDCDHDIIQRTCSSAEAGSPSEGLDKHLKENLVNRPLRLCGSVCVLMVFLNEFIVLLREQWQEPTQIAITEQSTDGSKAKTAACVRAEDVLKSETYVRQV